MGSGRVVDRAGYMELRGVDNSCGAVRTAGTGLLRAHRLDFLLVMVESLPSTPLKALAESVRIRHAGPRACQWWSATYLFAKSGPHVPFVADR